MENLVVEATYPITFRQDDAQTLGKYLQGHHSVVLIGMKRVGISNFLRFFLNHKDIIPTYISRTDKHLFIPVDLSDLVEREIFPFWILTLKRISDTVAQSSLVDRKVKKEIEGLFLSSIQSKDLFLVIDNVRRSLRVIIQSGVYPTLFFLRFDRIKEVVTAEFFDNLQGLKDATHQKMSYVFTSYRGLDKLAPSVFTKSSLSMFSHDMYIKPVRQEDVRVVCKSYQKMYRQHLPLDVRSWLHEIVDGYIQYLQLGLILLRTKHIAIKSKEDLFSFVMNDEQINLQSEELWESFDPAEQGLLIKVVQGARISSEDKTAAKYLWDTGVLTEKAEKQIFFSPLFLYYVKQKIDKKVDQNGIEFTKKEHLLFQVLKEQQNQVCEREIIIERVWKEAESFGVSDWAIDRLVARVRGKLKRQGSEYEIQTIKTRGYKLVSSK
ncbi:MAG: helix-turn-helix domain-containing protein [Candidatus Levybacteria bacterium]|nr:helix-turn-helix domain-containing protein [Candidatus Levybacteria bacterium]